MENLVKFNDDAWCILSRSPWLCCRAGVRNYYFSLACGCCGFEIWWWHTGAFLGSHALFQPQWAIFARCWAFVAFVATMLDAGLLAFCSVNQNISQAQVDSSGQGRCLRSQLHISDACRFCCLPTHMPTMVALVSREVNFAGVVSGTRSFTKIDTFAPMARRAKQVARDERLPEPTCHNLTTTATARPSNTTITEERVSAFSHGASIWYCMSAGGVTVGWETRRFSRRSLAHKRIDFDNTHVRRFFSFGRPCVDSKRFTNILSPSANMIRTSRKLQCCAWSILPHGKQPTQRRRKPTNAFPHRRRYLSPKLRFRIHMAERHSPWPDW